MITFRIGNGVAAVRLNALRLRYNTSIWRADTDMMAPKPYLTYGRRDIPVSTTTGLSPSARALLYLHSITDISTSPYMPWYHNRIIRTCSTQGETTRTIGPEPLQVKKIQNHTRCKHHGIHNAATHDMPHVAPWYTPLKPRHTCCTPRGACFPRHMSHGVSRGECYGHRGISPMV